MRPEYGLYLYQHQLVEVIHGAAQGTPGGRILEVGCGKGNELIECANMGLQCVGLDYSEEALALFRHRLSTMNIPVTLLKGDARMLPFGEAEFDIVYSQGVLEHFRDELPVLNEQYRVLKPGGFVIVEVPNKWTLYTVYKKIMMMFNLWAPGWETQYSPRMLQRLIEQADFLKVDIVGWDFLVWKAFRKIRRLLGFHDRPEGPALKTIRQKVQRNPLLLYLFASITIVGQKPKTAQ